VTPDTVLLLANLTVPRKPGRGPRIYPDPLANRETAAQALGIPRLDTAELRTLRELHKTTVELVDALLGGRPLTLPAARLTRLAEPSAGRVRLEVGDDQSLRARLDWSEPTPTARLARQVALELGEIDPQRLKRCALPGCDLAFYDTTRSGRRRWHAESPCGVRVRQRRHRAAARPGSPTELTQDDG
jgi:predicted RNA-binding Zn ribbon-like protein